MAESTGAARARTAGVGDHVEGVVSSIGPKLQHLRRQQRLSLQQLAARAEVSAAAIHKIERSDMVPTITTLLKISAALERPVSYFIEPDDGQPEPATLTRAGQRPAVFTPHRGLHLAGISGPVLPVLGRRCGGHGRPGGRQRRAAPDPCRRGARPRDRGSLGVRRRGDQARARSRRLAALPRRPPASLGERERAPGEGSLVRSA
jgi:transcriptional regulator with XRE-family HTH domain